MPFASRSLRTGVKHYRVPTTQHISVFPDIVREEDRLAYHSYLAKQAAADNVPQSWRDKYLQIAANIGECYLRRPSLNCNFVSIHLRSKFAERTSKECLLL